MVTVCIICHRGGVDDVQGHNPHKQPILFYLFQYKKALYKRSLLICNRVFCRFTSVLIIAQIDECKCKCWRDRNLSTQFPHQTILSCCTFINFLNRCEVLARRDRFQVVRLSLRISMSFKILI